MKFESKYKVIIAFIVGLIPMKTQAGAGPTDAEYVTLPPYCYARLEGDPQTKKIWKNRLGNNIFIHIHHYCFALNNMNRLNVVLDKRDRKGRLKSIIGDLNYVLGRWPPNHSLTQQAQALKAQAEYMQMLNQR